MRERLLYTSQGAAPRGIDVVFDPVGGSALNEALKCVRWSAHILFIGFASGHIPKVPVLPSGAMLSPHCTIDSHLQLRLSVALLACRIYRQRTSFLSFSFAVSTGKDKNTSKAALGSIGQC